MPLDAMSSVVGGRAFGDYDTAGGRNRQITGVPGEQKKWDYTDWLIKHLGSWRGRNAAAAAEGGRERGRDEGARAERKLVRWWKMSEHCARPAQGQGRHASRSNQ